MLAKPKAKRIRPADYTALICDILGALAVFTAFLVWLQDNDDSFICKAGAGICAILFVALWIRFSPGWTAALRGEQAEARPNAMTKRAFWRENIKIFCSLALVDIAVVFLTYMLLLARGDTDFRDSMLSLWNNSDGQHYMNIARDGYLSEGSTDRLVELVFLPGYPLLLRPAAKLTGDYLYGGLLASGLCFAAAGVMVYRLARLDMDEEGAYRALKYTCLMPGVFFYTGPMSESLFLLLSVSVIYCARQKRWLWAGFLGGLASFTRSLGPVLLAPVFFEMLADGNRRDKLARKCAALVLILLGFLLYCGVNYRVSGQWFKFLEYEREHWSQSMGLFFNTASYQIREALSCRRTGNMEMLLGLWLPNLLVLFASLALMLPAIRKMRPSYGVYFLCYYALSMGTTWLLSAPRYLTVCFPIPFALASMTESRRADSAATVCLSLFAALYCCAFVNRWYVW